MPKAIVDAVVARCQAGKLSSWEKSLKKKRGLSCQGLGEAVASIVGNQQKAAAKRRGKPRPPAY